MGNFKALGIYPLTAGKGVPAGRCVRGCNQWSLHFTSEVLQILLTLLFFFLTSHPRKHNNPKHTVCQISGVGIRLPDPSNSWQCSAGCVGGWKINLLARKNTAGLFSTAHPCAVNRGCWNRALGKNIKTHMYELRVSVLPSNMSSRWSSDCQSFRAESSMALLIIPAPRWASVGYCTISTKLGTGCGKDKKFSLLFFFFFLSNLQLWQLCEVLALPFFHLQICQSQKKPTNKKTK